MTLAILALLISSFGNLPGNDDLKQAQRYTYDKPSEAVANMMVPPGWALKFAIDHWDITSFYDRDGESVDFGNDAMEWNLRFVLGVSRIAEASIRNQTVVWWASALMAFSMISFDPGGSFSGDKPSTSALQNIFLRGGAQIFVTTALLATVALTFAWDIGPDQDSKGDLAVSDGQHALSSLLKLTYVASEVMRVFLIYECTRRFAENDFRLGSLANFGLGFTYQIIATQAFILWAGINLWYLREANYRFNGEKIDNTGGFLLTLGPALAITMLNNALTVSLAGSRNEYGNRIGMFGLSGENFQRPAKDFTLSAKYRF